ncbi:MAG: serine--tRNA ligase [Candidatus Algichlamydia australiensis]|nr:serine--tRNA ligase [Chlamydiales bacterium]
MLNIKEIREHPEEIEKRLRTKEKEISLTPILKLDEQHRNLLLQVEEMRSQLKKTSKMIGEKKRAGEDTSAIMKEVGGLGDEIQKLEHEMRSVEEQLQDSLARLPNLPDPDVKISLDPADNVCIKTHGEKKNFSFMPKNHLELAEKHHLLDFKRGAKISGSGWPVYRDLGARLELALLNYMIETHIKNGFEFILTPYLVKRDAMMGAGQLPKFEEQLFKLEDPDYPLMLIPTGEVPLNGLHLDEILDAEELPKRYTTYTPCFRREAGAAGSTERGLIRVHQFNKVEMYCFTKPEESDAMFEKMVRSAEEILEGLELHYRSMLLVTGDMSFPASRTVDVEVFLPGQDRYYEVSSVSNCRDFQARRSKTRFREKGEKPQLVHTLNGSGVATARLFVALLENNQREDGSIAIPKALQPYLGGISEIHV